jgi:hypothetical protein
MDRLYPGLGEHLEEETTVAIDGAIHETAYFQPIREGGEIFFIPKLEGGGAGSATTINGANSVYFATLECTKSRLVGEGAAPTSRARISYFRAAA